MKKSIIRLLAIFLTLVGFSPAAFAADANLTFASSVSSSQIGSEIKITVNASIAGFNAASTTFKVTYDPNMLEYVSHSGSGSGFPVEFSEPSVANGTITHSRGKTGSGVTGNVKVVEYTFKAKNNGSTTIRFGPSQIWESGTGAEKSLETNATVNLSFSSQQQSSTSTPTPSQSSSSSSSTPKPKVTAKPATPKPTATPTSTAKPSTSATATPTATPTPASGTASPSQSTVTMNATTAVANGTDKIDVNVIVRDESGAVLTNVEPAFAGLRDGDTATPFVFDSVTQSWSASLSSTSPGTLFLTVSAGGVDIANQDVAFTGSSTPTPTQTTGSSFTTIILVGFLILLVLLFERI